MNQGRSDFNPRGDNPPGSQPRPSCRRLQSRVATQPLFRYCKTTKPLLRAAETNHYEELGIPQDASPEQIREAFRALARLLHPDQQTDHQLKTIAERQMRKVNRIYGVLSDPERRRRYDDSLQQNGHPAILLQTAKHASKNRFLTRLPWLAAGVLVAGVLIWLASESPGIVPAQIIDRPSVPAAQRSPASPASAENTTEIAQLRTDLRIALAERDAALRELARTKNPAAHANVPATADNSPRPEAALDAVTEQPSLSLKPMPPVVAAPVALRPAARRQFAGFWFYARPPQGQRNTNQALYPPEFIEATITEQNGSVHGRYRSRYHIVDRAISPDVNFEFSGTPNGTTLHCPFTGPGGARGEITLQLTAENSLSVEWAASELGSTQGLTTGVAKLIRRID